MSIDQHSTTADLLLGAVAGGVATVALGGVTSALYDREDRTARRREDRARGGESAYEVAADRVAKGVGVGLSNEQRSRAGTAIHYGIGVGSGSLYGAVRRSIPLPGPARGLAFGAALWLVADEGATPALGLTPGPGSFPWQTHARGLVAHLVFGLVAEGVLAAGDALRAKTIGRPSTPIAPSRESARRRRGVT